ncbi:MAG TPA: hypothetical protein VF801_14845 [Rhodocyclaceae bacterium]
MHEIIHVVDAAKPPFAAPGHDLEVEAVDGRALPAGYYFVLWSTRKGSPRKRGKRYFGPFRTAGEARLLLMSAWMLGLVHHAEPHTAVAVCRSVARAPAAANDCYSPLRIERRSASRAG